MNIAVILPELDSRSGGGFTFQRALLDTLLAVEPETNHRFIYYGKGPVDVASDRLRNGTVHDDADIFAGLAAPEIELIAIPQVDAAVERARLVLAEIRLFVSQLRRAPGPRFGQHEVKFELDILELVKRRQAAASLARHGRHAGNHAVLGPPTSVLGIG